MASFNYLNQNNPIAIGEDEAQEMVNCSIDKNFLEFNKFDISEKEQNAGQLLYLPNGKEVSIMEEQGVAKWRNRDSQDQFESFYLDWDSSMYPSMAIESKPDAREYFCPESPREVFYAVTIYDKKEFIESEPFYSHPSENDIRVYSNLAGSGGNFQNANTIVYEQANINAQNAVKITLRLPANYDLQANGERYEFRIYRIQVGGTEYLLMKQIPFNEVNTPDSYTVAGITYQGYYKHVWDDIKDEDLNSNAIMDTDKIVYEPLINEMKTLALYADKLWIGGATQAEESNKNKGILWFSATGEYWKFNASFFFSFVDPVIGLTTFNEMLVVQTEKKLYIIYGDSEDNFVQKEIDFQFDGIAVNSGQGLSGLAYFLANPDKAEDKSLVNRVFVFNGSTVTDISQKIIKEFNFKFKKTCVLDNRYFVIEKKNGEKLILDTLKIGWCKANDEQYYFSYRTKEFSMGARGLQFLKQLYVRAKGAFIVFLIGDNDKIITQKRLQSSKTQDHFIYVKPRRMTTFSIRFVGYEDTEIYDWGIAE